MSNFKIHKVTAVPSSPVANSVYLVKQGASHVEMYVTDKAGTARRVINEGDIDAMIKAGIAGLSSLEVVADIAARDALKLGVATQVMVLDAAADSSVKSGAATYIYRPASGSGSTAVAASWVKISEAESLDLSLSWAALTGKPASKVADIDAAVSASHSHANTAALSKIGQGSDGKMTYDGDPVATQWASTAW